MEMGYQERSVPGRNQQPPPTYRHQSCKEVEGQRLNKSIQKLMGRSLRAGIEFKMLLSDQKGISDRQKSAAEYQRWLKYSDLNVQAPAAPHPQDLGITEYPEIERAPKGQQVQVLRYK